MRRREFISLIGCGAATVAARGARAQDRPHATPGHADGGRWKRCFERSKGSVRPGSRRGLPELRMDRCAATCASDVRSVGDSRRPGRAHIREKTSVDQLFRFAAPGRSSGKHMVDPSVPTFLSLTFCWPNRCLRYKLSGTADFPSEDSRSTRALWPPMLPSLAMTR